MREEKVLTLRGKKAVWGPIDHNVLPEGYPYKEGSKTVIEWDGNTDGRVSVYMAAMGATYYKVSDATPQKADLVGGMYTVTLDNRETEIAENGLMKDGDVIRTATPEVVVALSDGASASGLVFPEAGVYFMLADYYVSNLTYGSETIHPMAEEFLPALTSPNGTKYQLTVADDGTLSAVQV